MSRGIRIATAVGALSATCLMLLPLANGASAAGPALEDYQMVGFARGVTFTFSFKDFVLEKILDIGIPHAAVELGTSAGGSGRAEAAQLFPGDVVAGAAPGALAGVGDGLAGAPPPFSTVGGAVPRALPGYSVSYYPPGQSADFNTASSLLGREIPSSAGPITFDAGRIQTAARLKDASAAATSHRVLIANGATAILDAASIKSTSVAKANGSIVTHTARTAIHDLTLTLTPDLVIKVGDMVTEAKTSSNGATSEGAASVSMSDVRVTSGGDTFAATIDGKGIHITGPLPEGVPGSFDTDLATNQVLQTLSDIGVSIRAADDVEIIEGASSEASIGGLIVGFTGRIPRFPVPDIVGQALDPIIEGIKAYCPAQGKLPPPAQEQDIPPPFDAIFTQLPVCVSPQLVPGPGTGVVSSISIGSVDSISAASQGIDLGPPLGPAPGGPGGFQPQPFVPGGGVNPPSIPGTQPLPGTPAAPKQLFGLAARLPSGALVFPALGFLVLAAGVAMGSSLRRWQRPT